MGPELNAPRTEHEAEARSRAYALVARLISAGPQTRLIAAAVLDPRVAAAVERYRGDADALAVDHQHVFGFACPPYASALLEPDACVGGGVSESLRRALPASEANGPGGEPPDHLATQLYALALFTGAQADAERDGEVAVAERLATACRHLLDAHLLRWLPMYAQGVRRSGRAWPQALIDLVEEVVLQHRSRLGPAEHGELSFELPGEELSLDDPSTGLREVAELLARPARSGCVITRDDVLRLARDMRTPCGFGDRKALLENLLESSASLGTMSAVLSGLGELVREARRELRSSRLADVPSELTAAWLRRMERTSVLLERMTQAASSEPF